MNDAQKCPEERTMSQSPYGPRRVERRRLKPPGGPLSGRSGPYSLAQGERERDMSDAKRCPKCNKPLKEGPMRFGGGEDCDFDDDQATGPRIAVCDCGVRFVFTPKEAAHG